MRTALDGSNRYVATAGHAKYALFTWVDSWTLASNATDVFAFDDDFSMGGAPIRRPRGVGMAPKFHPGNATALHAFFGFCDFPLARLCHAQRDKEAGSSRALLARRSQICDEAGLDLTTLYKATDNGAYADLKKLHRALDGAVAAAVGQNDDEIVKRLLALNRGITNAQREYEPFAV